MTKGSKDNMQKASDFSELKAAASSTKKRIRYKTPKEVPNNGQAKQETWSYMRKDPESRTVLSTSNLSPPATRAPKSQFQQANSPRKPSTIHPKFLLSPDRHRFVVVCAIAIQRSIGKTALNLHVSSLAIARIAVTLGISISVINIRRTCPA